MHQLYADNSSDMAETNKRGLFIFSVNLGAALYAYNLPVYLSFS